MRVSILALVCILGVASTIAQETIDPAPINPTESGIMQIPESSLIKPSVTGTMSIPESSLVNPTGGTMSIPESSLIKPSGTSSINLTTTSTESVSVPRQTQTPSSSSNVKAPSSASASSQHPVNTNGATKQMSSHFVVIGVIAAIIANIY